MQDHRRDPSGTARPAPTLSVLADDQAEIRAALAGVREVLEHRAELMRAALLFSLELEACERLLTRLDVSPTWTTGTRPFPTLGSEGPLS